MVVPVVATLVIAWAARSVVSVLTTIGFGKFVNQTSQLLLDDLDAFGDNTVGRDGTGGLDVKVKALWHGIVIERLALLGRLFPVGVLRRRPGEKMVSNQSHRRRTDEVKMMECTYHSFLGSCSYHKSRWCSLL